MKADGVMDKRIEGEKTTAPSIDSGTISGQIEVGIEPER